MHVEMRKWRRPATIIEGVDDKNIDLEQLTKELKGLCACGGAVKRNTIILQGDHRIRAKEFLAKSGFPPENIEVI